MPGIHFATRRMRQVVGDATSEALAEQHMPRADAPSRRRRARQGRKLLADMLEPVDGALADALAMGMSMAAPVDGR